MGFFCSRTFTHNLLCDSPAVNVLCTSAMSYCVSGDKITCFPVYFLFQHLPGRMSLGVDVEPGVILISAYAVTYGHLLFAYTLTSSHAAILCLPLPGRRKNMSSPAVAIRQARFCRGQGIRQLYSVQHKRKGITENRKDRISSSSQDLHFFLRCF